MILIYLRFFIHLIPRVVFLLTLIPGPTQEQLLRISGGRTQSLLEREEEALTEAGSLEKELLQGKDRV